MYIYLDESYNLKNRNKKQFISINGFMVLNEKSLFKKWKDCRKPFLFKNIRIHANNKIFNKLRAKALKIVNRPDLTLLSSFQVLQEISFKKNSIYFYRGKLNFDKIYFDLIIKLFQELNLGEYRNIKIVIDSRKYRSGVLGKKNFKQEIKKFLRTQHRQVNFEFKMQPSTTDILLELADFISNIFYRVYINDDKQFFEDLRCKIIQIKNPLK